MSRLAKRALALGALVAAGVLSASCDTTSPVFLTGITVGITTGSNVLSVGQTVQAHATARYSDGEEVDITRVAVWQSTNPAAITVTPPGLVVAVTPGNAAVRATYGGQSAEMNFRAQ